MKVELLSHWGDDLTVVNNARVSFDKESQWKWDCIGPGEMCGVLSEADQRLIGFLARGCTKGDWDHLIVDALHAARTDQVAEILTHVKRMPEHWAPFANGVGMRFRVKAPIPIMRQLFKHKIGSVESEVSRRYVDDLPEAFVPTWRKAAENVKQGSGEDFPPDWQKDINYEYGILCDMAIGLYSNMIKQGVCPEQARFVLPQGVYTEAIISNSLYGWARVFNQRSDRGHAQREIADIADLIGAEAEKLFPVSWRELTK